MYIKFRIDNEFELLVDVKNNKHMGLIIIDLSSSKVLLEEEIEFDLLNLDRESIVKKSIRLLRSKYHSEYFIGDVKHVN